MLELFPLPKVFQSTQVDSKVMLVKYFCIKKQILEKGLPEGFFQNLGQFFILARQFFSFGTSNQF